jgi:tRNA pseudouridine38-40 synthase
LSPTGDTDNKANASKAYFYNYPFNNNITILSSVVAPDTMITNQNYDPSLPDNESNPKKLRWDVRFSATQRIYAYRILHSYHTPEANPAASYYHSQPFEHDRVWRIHDDKGNVGELDIDAMNRAAKFLVGTHDFTSFRGKGCQRSSPVTTLDDVVVHKERYHGIVSGFMLAQNESGNIPESFHLITIIIKGKSFLYHQVRNIVACLVEVGQGRLTPSDVQKILEKKDRSAAPGMAPAQGLFLVDVKHEPQF